MRSVLCTTNHPSCNCIDTWQYSYIVYCIVCSIHCCGCEPQGQVLVHEYDSAPQGTSSQPKLTFKTLEDNFFNILFK